MSAPSKPSDTVAGLLKRAGVTGEGATESETTTADQPAEASA